MAGGDITPEEFERLGRIAAELGCSAVKITGGEPTLRPDIVDIVARFSRHFDDVSMTTNGLLLERLAEPLKEAGLDRVNVSMDTLDPDRFRALTRGGDVFRVRRGIEAAVAAGLAPVKVNMVVVRGVNEDAVDDMTHYVRDVGASLQLIELHTDRKGAAGVTFRESFVSLGPVEAGLAERADRVDVAPQHGRKRYHLTSAEDREALAEAVPSTMVEVVRPFGNAGFCAQCFRLRLTGDGWLKPCLMRTDDYVDVVRPLRAGADDEALRALFLEANARRAPYWPEGMRAKASGVPVAGTAPR